MTDRDVKYIAWLLGEMGEHVASGNMPPIVANWILRAQLKHLGVNEMFVETCLYDMVQIAVDLCLVTTVRRHIFGTHETVAKAGSNEWLLQPYTDPEKQYALLAHSYTVHSKISLINPGAEEYAIARAMDLRREMGHRANLQPWIREKVDYRILRLTLGLPI